MFKKSFKAAAVCLCLSVVTPYCAASAKGWDDLSEEAKNVAVGATFIGVAASAVCTIAGVTITTLIKDHKAENLRRDNADLRKKVLSNYQLVQDRQVTARASDSQKEGTENCQLLNYRGQHAVILNGTSVQNSGSLQIAFGTLGDQDDFIYDPNSVINVLVDHAKISPVMGQ